MKGKNFLCAQRNLIVRNKEIKLIFFFNVKVDVVKFLLLCIVRLRIFPSQKCWFFLCSAIWVERIKRTLMSSSSRYSNSKGGSASFKKHSENRKSHQQPPCWTTNSSNSPSNNPVLEKKTTHQLNVYLNESGDARGVKKSKCSESCSAIPPHIPWLLHSDHPSKNTSSHWKK